MRAAIEWIAGDDTGLSSKTIWCVMMGVPCGQPSIPYDDGDFGRCYRLLEKFPAWRKRLHEVAAAHPRWDYTVKIWDDWEAGYIARHRARA